MRYVVHGYRNQVISVEVEADSPEEAMSMVVDGPPSVPDVWDTDYQWHVAYPEG